MTRPVDDDATAATIDVRFDGETGTIRPDRGTVDAGGWWRPDVPTTSP